MKKEAQRSEQTHWVSPHIRGMDNSPNNTRVPTTIITTSFIDTKQNADVNFIDSSMKQNHSNNKIYEQMSENKQCTEQEDMTQSSNENCENIYTMTSSSRNSKRKKDEDTLHVKFDLDVVPNYRSHQKRSSYQLMQEMEMGEREVMIAKI